jgi:NAD(P)-dependent dehydrogenase (short-subunit alcohol dehydrogenase family)
MSSKGSDPSVVVVTGASAGVGRATALAFACRGAKVALLARGTEGLAAASDEVEAAGGSALAVQTDVADFGQVEAAAERAEAELGPIDVWVNNAMATIFAPLTQVAPEEYRRATEVTYLGTVYGTMAALKRMVPRDRGTIIQVGSALAYRAIPLQAAYCGAKHGMKGFTQSLRCELLHEGSAVKVTMVQMPALNTPQFDVSRSRMPRRARPVPPIYQPEVAADAIVRAALHPRREYYVGGSTVAAILGQRIAPPLGDLYLARTGYDAQQTDEPERDRPDNLFEPVPGDHGAHGQFDSESRSRSVQWMAEKHRSALVLAGGVLLGALLRK